jgi:hypothetical protein
LEPVLAHELEWGSNMIGQRRLTATDEDRIEDQAILVTRPAASTPPT